MKICSKCGAERRSSSGWCTKCVREHNANRKRLLVDSIKAKGCVTCGDTRLPVLDFHHIGGKEDRVKKISTLVLRGSYGTLKTELDKCICVCANCHRMLHAEEVV